MDYRTDKDDYYRRPMANQDTSGPLMKGLQIKNYVSADEKNWHQTLLLKPESIKQRSDVIQDERNVPVHLCQKDAAQCWQWGKSHTWNT